MLQMKWCNFSLIALPHFKVCMLLLKTPFQSPGHKVCALLQVSASIVEAVVSDANFLHIKLSIILFITKYFSILNYCNFKSPLFFKYTTAFK